MDKWEVYSGNRNGSCHSQRAHVKELEYKIELLNQKLEVALADSERWKRKYRGMSDTNYGPVDSSRNSSRKSL
jgi:hypothetical protein